PLPGGRPAPPHPGGGPRAERRSRPGQPHRRAPRGPGRRVTTGHAPGRRGGDREPGPLVGRGRRTAPVAGATAGGRLRRKPRRPRRPPDPQRRGAGGGRGGPAGARRRVHRRPPGRRARAAAGRPGPPRGHERRRPHPGPPERRRRPGRPRRGDRRPSQRTEGAGVTRDLSAPRKVHIVGIGGMAMSGIAAVLTRLGHTVSGSYLKAWRGLERLRLLGVDVHVPHEAPCLPADVDAVVVSPAIPPTNPEVAAARERGVPVLRRAEALAAIVDTRRTVA